VALFYLLPTNAVALTNLQLFDVAGCFHVIVFGIAQTFLPLAINHGREYSKKSLLF